MNLEYVICVLGIITCVFILLRTIRNYKLLNNRYVELQTSICLSNCQNGLFKTEDFFYMKNDGINPCEPINVIQYIDYIGKSDVFMEIE